MKLEDFTMSDVLNYYTDYLMNECNIGIKSKAEVKKYIINALTYNVVREAVVEQVAFLKENVEE